MAEAEREALGLSLFKYGRKRPLHGAEPDVAG